MWKESFFWFSQPSSYLINYDRYFAWLFVGLFVLGIILKAFVRLSKNPVTKKLINKFGNLGLNMGLIGLLWFGLRYESTPIFGDRSWAGAIILLSLIWLAFIVKYILTDYRREQQAYSKTILNSKYI